MPKYDSLTQIFVGLQQSGKSNQEINDVALQCVGIVESELNVSLRKPISQERLAGYTTIGGSPHLDGEYTVFGRVVEGLDVIDKIAAVPVQGTAPITPLFLTMEVESISKKKLTDLYGYEYPAE